MCEELIYEGSSTTSGAPQFTPRQIQDTMIQLRDMTKKLEQGILDVVKDIENKKKVSLKDAKYFWLFESIGKLTKKRVQTMKFLCCLNMGFNLKNPELCRL